MANIAELISGYLDLTFGELPDSERVTIVRFLERESHRAWVKHPDVELDSNEVATSPIPGTTSRYPSRPAAKRSRVTIPSFVPLIPMSRSREPKPYAHHARDSHVFAENFRIT